MQMFFIIGRFKLLLQQPQDSVENSAPILCKSSGTISYKYPNNQYQTFRTKNDFTIN